MVNYALFVFHALLFLMAFFVVPLASPEFVWVIPFLALFTNQHWALLHECIHGSFHPNRKVNNIAGRVLGVFFGASFTLVRASHLLHHQVNRTEMEQLEVYTGKSPAPSLSQFSYYFSLFCGLFLSELLGTLLLILPRKWLEALRKPFFNADNFSSHVFALILDRKGKLEEARLDACIILACLIVGFWLYGGDWWALAAFLAIRMVLVSFLDYLYHYDSPLGNPQHGYNLQLSPLASKFILHFNLHGVHHKNPGVAWRELPTLFAKTEGVYDGDYVVYAARQLKGLKPMAKPA